MSSGGDSYGADSSDDDHHNRRSHSSHRRQPLDLPDDDDSEHEAPQQHRSSKSSRRHDKSSKRSPAEYDDEEEEDRGDDRRRDRGRSRYDDDDDDDDDIKPNIDARNHAKRASNDANKYTSDNDYDDEYDNEDRNRSRSRGSGKQKSSPLDKRPRSDDERDDDDERIERDYKKAKKEEWEVEANENMNNPSNNGYASSDDENENKEDKSKNLSLIEKEIEKSKLSRRRKNEPAIEVIENECVSFLERMKKARDDDLRSFKNSQPALEKIKMLRDVERMMTKVHHREYLLDNMLLAAFRSWLDRLPDGSLPNIQVRTTLLNILFELKLDEDWVDRLESSQGLGKIIHYLSKKDDHKPNQRLAEKIMMKWARPVYRMNSNFTELLYEFDKPDEGHKAGRESVAAERKAAMRTVQRIKTTEEKLRDSRRGEKSNKIMATVPRPTPFLFTTVAEGTTQMDEKEAKEIRVNRAKQKRMSRTISNLRRLSKASGARGDKPSLNGR